jgi:hypothetical protein
MKIDRNTVKNFFSRTDVVLVCMGVAILIAGWFAQAGVWWFAIVTAVVVPIVARWLIWRTAKIHTRMKTVAVSLFEVSEYLDEVLWGEYRYVEGWLPHVKILVFISCLVMLVAGLCAGEGRWDVALLALVSSSLMGHFAVSIENNGKRLHTLLVKARVEVFKEERIEESDGLVLV